MPRSVRQSPKDVARLREADAAIHRRADLAAGIAIYRDVLKRFPDDPELLYHLGSAELMAGNVDDAQRRLRASLRIAPSPGAHRALARALELKGDAAGALEQIDRGLALAPGDPLLTAARADALFTSDRIDEAHALLEPLLDREPHPAVVLAFARLAHRVDRVDDAARLLEAALDRADPAQAPVVAYRLAGLLERRGDHDRAFEAAARANALRGFRFDADAFDRRIDRAIAEWSRARVEALPTPSADTSRPILIVGMPRSGTSLAEQIIASHPDVAAGGELGALAQIAADLGAERVAPPILESPEALTKPALARASRRYLNALRDVDRAAPRVTDKMPTNLLNLGLAGAIAPGARIVRCARDPRDTCLSCYFQSFGEGLPFATDLRHLAVVSNAERRLAAHWKRVLDVHILDLAYEDLVADLPAGARRLIDFLGLDWDPACETPWLSGSVSATASIDQVRRPVYTSSIGRWKHYERHLAPLLDALDLG